MPLRISQLPSADLPLSPDDLVVVNQGNITKTASVSDVGTSFPLLRSSQADNSATQIAFETNAGVLNEDQNTRIRGVVPSDEGDAIMLMEAYLNSQWLNALTVNVVSDFCSGNFPEVRIPHLVVEESIDLPGNYVNTITAQSGLTTFGSTSGNVAIYVNMYEKSRISTSAAINTAETYIAVPIGQQTISAGDSFRITAYGTCTSSGGATVTFKLKIGSNGSTADATAYSVAFGSAGSGTNVPFKLEMVFTVRTLGTSGAMAYSASLLNNGTTGIASAAVQVFTPLTGTINTTAFNQFGLSFLTSNANTSATFYNVIVENLK